MNPFDNLTTSKPVPYDRNQKNGREAGQKMRG